MKKRPPTLVETPLLFAGPVEGRWGWLKTCFWPAPHFCNEAYNRSCGDVRNDCAATFTNWTKICTFNKISDMICPTQNISLADYYFGFLKNLNPDSKLDLISKLSQSLKETENVPEPSLQSLFGAYKSDETAEDIIAGLRASRVFNRNTELL